MAARNKKIQINRQHTTHTDTINIVYNYNNLQNWQKVSSELSYR